MLKLEEPRELTIIRRCFTRHYCQVDKRLNGADVILVVAERAGHLRDVDNTEIIPLGGSVSRQGVVGPVPIRALPPAIPFESLRNLSFRDVSTVIGRFNRPIASSCLLKTSASMSGAARTMSPSFSKNGAFLRILAWRSDSATSQEPMQSHRAIPWWL